MNIALSTIFAACVIFMLPIFLSRPIRHEYFNFVSRRLASLRRPKIVVTGDSLAAGGGLWGWWLFGRPFSAINLGRGGHTSKQVVGQVSQAVSMKPNFIMVSCGLNDAYLEVADTGSLDNSLSEMLQEVRGTTSHLIICLPHVPVDQDYSARLKSMRAAAKTKFSRETIIDLQDLLSDETGKIEGRYTTDGLHLSDAGYREWFKELKDVTSRLAR
jgi:lysophospholipase L1-like esterase